MTKTPVAMLCQNAMHFIKDLFNLGSITLSTAHYLWSIGTCPIPGCILIHCSVQSILTRNGPLNSPRKHVLGPCHARSFQMEFVKSNLSLCVFCAWSTTKKLLFQKDNCNLSERKIQVAVPEPLIWRDTYFSNQSHSLVVIWLSHLHSDVWFFPVFLLCKTNGMPLTHNCKRC